MHDIVFVFCSLATKHVYCLLPDGGVGDSEWDSGWRHITLNIHH